MAQKTTIKAQMTMNATPSAKARRGLIVRFSKERWRLMSAILPLLMFIVVIFLSPFLLFVGSAICTALSPSPSKLRVLYHIFGGVVNCGVYYYFLWVNVEVKYNLSG